MCVFDLERVELTGVSFYLDGVHFVYVFLCPVCNRKPGEIPQFPLSAVITVTDDDDEVEFHVLGWMSVDIIY